ncbi:unnamed protein product [Caenorhabditis sp. 36 PRJEB53466]|nr:unnamed protein product [Caenorhabditis sp. 36 PRJEB53466]
MSSINKVESMWIKRKATTAPTSPQIKIPPRQLSPEPHFEQGLPNYIPPERPLGLPKSENGNEMIDLLLKASTLLPAVKCEGVQLRVRQLEREIGEKNVALSGQMTLLKIAKEIDKFNCQEAWKLYQNAFEKHETTMFWTRGIRLLILELRDNQKLRIGQ